MRAIDADLIQYEPMLSPKGNGMYEDVMVAYKSQIDDLPTIEERKKGKWIHDGYNFTHGNDWIHCSECGKRGINVPADLTNFCQNCGADMRERREDE